MRVLLTVTLLREVRMSYYVLLVWCMRAVKCIVHIRRTVHGDFNTAKSRSEREEDEIRESWREKDI